MAKANDFFTMGTFFHDQIDLVVNLIHLITDVKEEITQILMKEITPLKTKSLHFHTSILPYFHTCVK